MSQLIQASKFKSIHSVLGQISKSQKYELPSEGDKVLEGV